jgi:predicted nucleotidyltransferase
MLHLRSSGSVTTISLNTAEVLASLSAIAARIRAAHPEVLSVRLFGSVARGDQAGTSDVDVLIVLKGDESGDQLEWIRKYYSYFRLPVPVDLLVYSEAQLLDRLQSGDPWFARIFKESIGLAG